MKSDQVLREQTVAALKGHAHMPFSEAVAKFPSKCINTKPPRVDYTFWHLVEHIRRTQRDILNFIHEINYVEPEWPADYWPEKNATATKKDWDESVSAVEKDLREMISLVENPKIDLLEPIPYGTGQTYLREVSLVADHNAYHIGEFAILRQVMNAWPAKHK